jgi:hypothetical protein
MKIILSFIILFSLQVAAQSFGFGCLGLVGGYGGVTYQQYQPELLNIYLKKFNVNAIKKMPEFGKAEGYRVGVNLFRARFSGFFITAKGFYQELKESHEIQKVDRGGIFDIDMELKFKGFGVGLDLGVPIFNRLLWKIVDGAVSVNSTRLTQTENSTLGTTVMKFNNDKTEIGYSFGTGFVLDILKNYISIEGIVGYNFFQVDEMTSEDKMKFENLVSSGNENKPFIKSGGLNAVVQLNIGFPL